MSRRNKPTKGQMMTIEEFRLFLYKYYNVPTTVFDSFRTNLIYYAVTEGKWVQYDRIFVGIGKMLYQRYQLSGPEILKALGDFDAICGSVLDKDENGEDTANWNKIMEEFRDATGIVIRTGDDNRLIVECDWEEEVYEEE